MNDWCCLVYRIDDIDKKVDEKENVEYLLLLLCVCIKEREIRNNLVNFF